MSGTALGAGDTAVNRRDSLSVRQGNPDQSKPGCALDVLDKPCSERPGSKVERVEGLEEAFSKRGTLEQ